MPVHSYIFGLFGIFLAVMAVPLMLRRVPPNPLYGLRMPATFIGWRRANRMLRERRRSS